MIRRLRAFGLLALLGIAPACGDDAVAPLDPAVAERIAGPVAWLQVGAALSGQGHSFLDNYLPLPRRGVAVYANTERGRTVRFLGCNLGDGIVVTGEGEIRWAGEGLASERGERFCPFDAPCPDALRWVGRLTVNVSGVSYRIDDLVVRDLVVRNPVSEPPRPLSATVDLGGHTVAVSDSALWDTIFDDAGIGLDAIPNPDRSPRNLTGADRARLAYHGGLALASFLINEAVESNRGEHTHGEPCAMTVTYPEPPTVHVDASWNSCSLRAGLFLDGSFTLDLDLQMRSRQVERITITAAGDLTLGGGVPTVDATSAVWTMTPIGSPTVELPGTMWMEMTLEGPGGSIRFAESFLVDD